MAKDYDNKTGGECLFNYSYTMENYIVVKKNALYALIWKDLQDILSNERNKQGIK